MNKRLLPALLAAALVFAPRLHAQLTVDMTIKRRLYVMYEPILVTVSIANHSGRDITLNDADGQKWFSFQITNGDGQVVAPINGDYQLNPLTIPAGQTVRRSLNLAALYKVHEFGSYHAKASVYSPDYHQYFSSRAQEFQVTDGRIFWQQTVGVPAGYPGAGSTRTISFLMFRPESQTVLYIRVQDKDGGVVYITSPLGKLLSGFDPEIQLDKNNQVHVLQLIGAKTFVYTIIGLNGEWLAQDTYNAVRSRPVLRKTAAGDVEVKGGDLDVPVDASVAKPNVPKVSDRPQGFPQLK
jgi:hypothetical protein